jgi:NAD kinase
VVDLVVRSNDQAMFTLDGFLDFPLRTGDTVRIQHSPHQARFLRSRDPRELPGVLIDRLSSARARERGPQSEV